MPGCLVMEWYVNVICTGGCIKFSHTELCWEWEASSVCVIRQVCVLGEFFYVTPPADGWAINAWPHTGTRFSTIPSPYTYPTPHTHTHTQAIISVTATSSRDWEGKDTRWNTFPCKKKLTGKRENQFIVSRYFSCQYIGSPFWWH